MRCLSGASLLFILSKEITVGSGEGGGRDGDEMGGRAEGGGLGEEKMDVMGEEVTEEGKD